MSEKPFSHSPNNLMLDILDPRNAREPQPAERSDFLDLFRFQNNVSKEDSLPR